MKSNTLEKYVDNWPCISHNMGVHMLIFRTWKFIPENMGGGCPTFWNARYLYAQLCWNDCEKKTHLEAHFKCGALSKRGGPLKIGERPTSERGWARFKKVMDPRQRGYGPPSRLGAPSKCERGGIPQDRAWDPFWGSDWPICRLWYVVVLDVCFIKTWRK